MGARKPAPAVTSPKACLPKVRLSLALALLLAALPAMAATLSGTPDRTSINSGETIRYVLSLKGAVAGRVPDLGPLGGDFDIVDRQERRETRIVGGRRVEDVEWVLTLAPKRAGKLTIPALAVAGEHTAPVTIEVAEIKNDAPLFIQTEVGAGPIFVQSEVPVALRVYDSLGIRDGSLSDLTADGAIITRQGLPTSYLRMIGTRQYRVIEQNYLMRPQRSGKIELQPVTVVANVPSGNGGIVPAEKRLAMPGFQSPLDRIVDPGRDISLRSMPVFVDVIARPADATGWFLPARAVTLTAYWSTPVADAKVGDTLTRTIRLEALGASPNQLPPIAVPDADGARQYEDASRSGGTQINGEAGAVAVKTVSVVPTRAGEVTLPPIEVAWWNIETNRQEVAVAPAVTFLVRPDAPLRAAAAPPPAAPAAPADTPRSEEKPAAEAPPASATWLQVLAQWGERVGTSTIGASFAIAIALSAMVAWFRQRQRQAVPLPERGEAELVEPGAGYHPTAEPAERARTQRTPRSAEAALEAACKAGDAPAAHSAFLAWVRQEAGKGYSGLRAADLRTARLADAVSDLQQHLYSQPAGPWDGKAFLAAFEAEKRARRRSQKPARGARLAPLYPEAG